MIAAIVLHCSEDEERLKVELRKIAGSKSEIAKAKRLECDGDKGAFEEKLGKIAKTTLRKRNP